MRIDTMSVLQAVRGLWRWWAGEIGALLPAGLLRLWHDRRRDLECHYDGADLVVSFRQGERCEELGRLSLNQGAPETVGAALRTLLCESSEGYDRLLIRLDESRLLRRHVRLPLAARRDLAEALEYDIDRQTPFAAEDVYFGSRERAVDEEAGEVEAELAVIRRGDLDPVLETLAAAGLVPDRIEGAAGGPDLRPATALPPPMPLLWPRATASLAIAAVLLALSGMVLPFARLADTRAELDARLAQARAEAVAVDRMRQNVETLQSRRSALFARKAREPSVLSLIEELTRAVPMEAFVTELTVTENEITISGYARKASEVLGAVETAPHFDAARFLSPVTQDRRLERERFSLAARILADPEETSAGAPAADAGAALP